MYLPPTGAGVRAPRDASGQPCWVGPSQWPRRSSHPRARCRCGPGDDDRRSSGRRGGDVWETCGTWGDVCSLCANIRKDVFFFGKPNALRERRWTKKRVGVGTD